MDTESKNECIDLEWRILEIKKMAKEFDKEE